MSEAAARRAAPIRWRRWAAGAAIGIVLGLGVCEALGWPFLVAPVQRWLGETLARRVSFGAGAGAGAGAASDPKVRIRLLGAIRISADHLEIGAPAWSRAPHMLLADDARLTLGYADLWRASRGERLRIRLLRAARLDAHIERRADGRASWRFGASSDTPDSAGAPTHAPRFDRLQFDAGTLAYRDALMALDLDATYSLVDRSNVSAAELAPATTTARLQFAAEGTYRQQPLHIELKTSGVLPVIADDATPPELPVALALRVGGARLTFEGSVADALHLGALKGRFSVQGPSLAAVGDPLHVTLPTTGPFRAEGLVAKQGPVWNTLIERATIGSSRLAGAFSYDPRAGRPMLAGRLTGSTLLLADLGPAVGAPARKSAAVPEVAPAPAVPRARAAPGHVLPSREFDLPALRAMDANVLIDIDRLDLGSGLLEPLEPLRTHLVLTDGVLTLRDLEARTGQGRLLGVVQLDGRRSLALWTADLRWSDVRLERWIHQARAAGAPPYATGRVSGQARVAGQGRSTAAILGSLRGGVRMQLVGGTISHLAVEAAGLDIAQALGVFIKGDDALPVQCSVVDLVADQGLLTPRVLVLDTPDSTLWVDGTISLANEVLDLRVVTTPKDFSPLALRTPVRLRGSFADPAVVLEKGPLGARIGASVLLGLLNPLAAILPLMDIGSSDDAQRGAAACRALAQRIAARPLLPPPPAQARR